MRLVFDIGGTHLRVAASADGIQVAEPLIVDTPRAWSDAREALTRLMQEASGGTEPEVVSGGVAGVVHDGVLVRPSPSLPDWQDARIADALHELYPHARISVENDAAVACLGEAHVGAGLGAGIVAYLTVGTGIGGACVTDGKLQARAEGYEPGRDIIEYSTGKTVESIASGRAIMERYGTRISMASEEAQEEVAHALAVAAHNAAAFWSPHVIVLGGGVVRGEPGLFERIARQYEALPALYPQMPRLRLGTLGEKAGLVGALML